MKARRWHAPPSRPAPTEDQSVIANARTGNVPKERTFGGTAKNRPPFVWQRAQVGHVLDDRDAVAEQLAVRGTVAVVDIVDVHRVDAHERGFVLDQRGDEVSGEEWRARAVGVGTPVAVPPGVEHDRMALDRSGRQGVRIDARGLLLGPAHDGQRQVCQPPEVEAGQVGAALVEVPRAVEVGARVGHHVDAADVERRAAAEPFAGLRCG